MNHGVRNELLSAAYRIGQKIAKGFVTDFHSAVATIRGVNQRC
jgi:hypothetical protein